ncbi:MAG: peptidylprolyl isomerase [Clostridia bacterium]|nr:peptidylprolyl isomerase [Clostridia bacterium]
MNRIKKAGCVLLVLLWMLPLFSAAAEGSSAAEDPIIVRVGDVCYTRSQIQPALQSDINLAQLTAGTYLTEEEQQAQRLATVERYVDAALIQVKLKEAGWNEFTAEEETTLKDAARNRYEQIWQGIWQKAQSSGEEFTEAQVSEFMEDVGYTVSAVYEEMKAYERRCRAIELYCPGLVITQDMIREYYEENFLNPDRERYENNLDLYETEIIAQKNESFYTPEGYRAIKQILLAYPKEVDRAVKNERARYNLAAQAMTEVMQQLLSAATQAESWEDMKDAKAAYDAAEAELKEARAELVKKRNAAARPLIQPTADAILEEFSAGIDIDTLIKRYSTDTNEANTTGGGYPFHPDSKNWTEEFSTAASRLRKPGEISQPVFSDLGIHILYYASDIPGGEHELTAQEEEILTASATDYYQGLELQKLIAEWKPDYEIETHPELMDE